VLSKQHPPRDETGWEQKPVDHGMILYLLCAVLNVESLSRYGVVEEDDLTSCSWVMVELSTRKREIRGAGGNRHERLGLKRILRESQFAIPNKAGTGSDPAGTITNTRVS
jgi:hypothetical protein